jgi:hypothetical protein
VYLKAEQQHPHDSEYIVVVNGTSFGSIHELGVESEIGFRKLGIYGILLFFAANNYHDNPHGDFLNHWGKKKRNPHYQELRNLLYFVDTFPYVTSRHGLLLCKMKHDRQRGNTTQPLQLNKLHQFLE